MNPSHSRCAATSRRTALGATFLLSFFVVSVSSAQPPPVEVEDEPEVSEDEPAASEEAPETDLDAADDDAVDDDGLDAGDAPDDEDLLDDELDDDSLYELDDALDAGDDEDEAAPTIRDHDLQLGEIVATGFRPEDALRVGGGVTVLDDTLLERFEYDDPHTILMQVPGVYVRTEDGFGLRPNIGLRGASSDRSKKITLMEDGVLFGPAPYSAPAAYYFPLMTRMVGVEVFKGPAALLYGPQTIGGALNLVSRPIPTRPEGGFDLSYGRFNTRKIHFHWGTSNRWGGVLFEALDIGSTGFKELDRVGAAQRADTGFSRSDFVLRGFLQSNPDRDHYHRVDLRLGFGRERSNETYLGLTDADFAVDPTRRYAASELDRMSWWRTSGVLSWRAELGDHVQIVTDLYRHDLDRNWLRFNNFGDSAVDPRQVLLSPTGSRAVYYGLLTGAEETTSPAQEIILAENRRRFVSQGGQTRLQIDTGSRRMRHHVEVGLRFHQDELRRDHLAHRYAMIDGQLTPTGADPETTADNLGWAFAFAGHAVYRLDVAGFTVTPGVRTEVIKTRLDDDLSGTRTDNLNAALLPGLGLTYRVVEGLSVLAGVHRGFSPVAPGQPDEVRPELSVNYEVGARYVDAERARHLELIGFVNDYSNLTGTCGFSTGCAADIVDRQFNGGDVLVWGLEAVASWRFDVGRFQLPLRVTYTYTGSRFRSAFDSEDPTFGRVSEGDELPYVPRHQAQLQAGVEHAKAGLHVVGTFVSAMREQAGQGDAGELTDMIAMVDVVGYWQVLERLRTYVRVENLFDQQPIASRRPFGARPVRPFMVQAGVKVEF